MGEKQELLRGVNAFAANTFTVLPHLCVLFFFLSCLICCLFLYAVDAPPLSLFVEKLGCFTD